LKVTPAWSSAGEGPLGVDRPCGAAQRCERGVEGALVGKGREIAEQGEAVGLMQGGEAFGKQATEQARQHAHRQEEAGLAGDPTRPIRRQSAAGNDDVDMGMMGERRPQVWSTAVSLLRAQMLRISGDGDQRLGCGPEHNILDTLPDRQQVRLAFREPLPRRNALTLRTVPLRQGL
jgi:hypothetical protein